MRPVDANSFSSKCQTTWADTPSSPSGPGLFHTAASVLEGRAGKQMSGKVPSRVCDFVRRSRLARGPTRACHTFTQDARHASSLPAARVPLLAPQSWVYHHFCLTLALGIAASSLIYCVVTGAHYFARCRSTIPSASWRFGSITHCSGSRKSLRQISATGAIRTGRSNRWPRTPPEATSSRSSVDAAVNQESRDHAGEWDSVSPARLASGARTETLEAEDEGGHNNVAIVSDRLWRRCSPRGSRSRGNAHPSEQGSVRDRGRPCRTRSACRIGPMCGCRYRA